MIAMLDYGTEAQKREHIPAIAKGLVRWCQGYSEPGAGSTSSISRIRRSPVTSRA